MRKIKKSKTNKRGEEITQVSAYVPIELYRIFSEDTIKQGLDETKMLIRILKKHYNYK